MSNLLERLARKPRCCVCGAKLSGKEEPVGDKLDPHANQGLMIRHGVKGKPMYFCPRCAPRFLVSFRAWVWNTPSEQATQTATELEVERLIRVLREVSKGDENLPV